MQEFPIVAIEFDNGRDSVLRFSAFELDTAVIVFVDGRFGFAGTDFDMPVAPRLAVAARANGTPS